MRTSIYKSKYQHDLEDVKIDAMERMQDVMLGIVTNGIKDSVYALLSESEEYVRDALDNNDLTVSDLETHGDTLGDISKEVISWVLDIYLDQPERLVEPGLMWGLKRI